MELSDNRDREDKQVSIGNLG